MLTEVVFVRNSNCLVYVREVYSHWMTTFTWVLCWLFCSWLPQIQFVRSWKALKFNLNCALQWTKENVSTFIMSAAWEVQDLTQLALTFHSLQNHRSELEIPPIEISLAIRMHTSNIFWILSFTGTANKRPSLKCDLWEIETKLTC